MGSLQVVGIARALVLFTANPIVLLHSKPTQIHLGLYCRTDRIPRQQTFVGLVSFDPGVRYERQSIMSYIMLEQSEFDGPGAGEATGEGEFAGCGLLRAWMGANDDDSRSIKMERSDSFIISILFSLKVFVLLCVGFIVVQGTRGLYIYRSELKKEKIRILFFILFLGFEIIVK